MARFQRFAPALETLEYRYVPAVVVTSGIDLDSDGATDDIRIVGDVKNNKIFIDDDGATLLIDVDKNGDGDFTDAGELLDDSHTPADGSIVVELRLGDGDDEITYLLTNDLSADRRLLATDLGLGNDDFVLDGGLISLTSSSELILDVLAGKGSDQLTVTLPNVVGSLVAVQAAMGGGFDHTILQTTGTSSLGTVDADLDLGGGSNECVVLVSTVGDTGAGFVDVNVTGGNSATQSDQVDVQMFLTVGGGGQVSAVSVDVDLQAGNDAFNGLLFSSYDVAALGIVDLSVQGGAGNDHIDLAQTSGSTININTNAILELELKGGLGNDSISVILFDVAGLEVDGRIRLRIEGNEGNDTITANIQYIVTSIGNLDIAIHAGAGNDTVIYDLEANGSPATFGPAGVAILDGGLGNDTLNDDSDPAKSDHHLFEIFV